MQRGYIPCDARGSLGENPWPPCDVGPPPRCRPPPARSAPRRPHELAVSPATAPRAVDEIGHRVIHTAKLGLADMRPKALEGERTLPKLCCRPLA